MHGTFTADENIKKAIRTCCIKAGLPFFLSCLIQEIRKRSSMSICIIQTVCVQPPRCFHGFLIGLSSLRKEALIMHSAVKCLQPEICAYPYSANIPAFHHLQEGLLKTPALYLF